MKKKVLLFLVLGLVLLSPSVLGIQLRSLPESFTVDAAINDCRVDTLSLLTDSDQDLSFDFSVSDQLSKHMHLSKVDNAHYNVYFHPDSNYVGKKINGIIYITATPETGILANAFGKVSFPIEVTINVKEQQEIFVRDCPVLGEQVEVVPLSLDAVALLVLVMVSLGVVNVTTRMKLKGKKSWKK